MTGDRKDKDLRGASRRSSDARGGRSTRRAFRPLRWAWLLLLVALLAPAYDLFLPAGYKPPRERRTVVIERGQSLHEIARELQRVGVIRSQAGFLVLARMMQLDRSVKAGQYSFRLGMTVPALLRALDRGMYGLNLVTIPEGLMVHETALLIQNQVGIPASAIDSMARDPQLLDSLGVAAPSLEGWLAPDSYEWLPGTSPEVVLRTMVARTRERVQRATAGYDSLPLGMNAHEVLTLASIVEAESRAKEERPRIARVYLNRLDRGMLLQADPTVGYALGRGPRSRLRFKDLRVESPYNTYRHEGLPPGPICSPGEAAIDAVMNATPGVRDLYFVARGEGRHLFAPTYEEHLSNIAFVRGKKAALAARTNPDAASDAEPDSEDIGANMGPAPALAALSKLPPARPGARTNGIAKPGAKTATQPAPAVAKVALTAPPPGGSGAAASGRSPSSSPSNPAVAAQPAPLKGRLLIGRSRIQAAASTPVDHAVPGTTAPAPQPDSIKSPAPAGAAGRSAASATTTARPAAGANASATTGTPAGKPATGRPSVAKPPAARAPGDSTHSPARKSAPARSPADTAHSPGRTSARAHAASDTARSKAGAVTRAHAASDTARSKAGASATGVSAHKPTSHASSTSDAATGKTSKSKPATNKPATSDAATSKTSESKPATSKAATNDAATSKASKSKPATSKPATSDATTKKPAASKPSGHAAPARAAPDSARGH